LTSAANMGVVILAAGSSSRLGHPKQLVPFQDKTLLQNVIDTAASFDFATSVLVLGANGDNIRKAIDPGTFTVLDNDSWPEGIASSIRLGVSGSIKINDSLDSILFLLSDQPFVTTQLIEKLISSHKNGRKQITACRYKKTMGVPAIFGNPFFPGLMELTGDVGARKIMLRNSKEVEEVTFKKGHIDIDTHEDYEQLRKKMNE